MADSVGSYEPRSRRLYSVEVTNDPLIMSPSQDPTEKTSEEPSGKKDKDLD